MSTSKSVVKKNVLAVMGLASALVLMVACGGSDAAAGGDKAPGNSNSGATAPATPLPGMITASDIKPPLADAIDQGMVAEGKQISEVKCLACHSFGSNRVVGPGWENILKQRNPEWIMNMILHTDAMLENDPEAQAMLEECLVRMPNQNLSNDEARDVLEFMRTLDKD